jgi:16S rRNA (adenine1518-N6/adenine1519-N6)-dimethyltransferase
MPNESSGDLVAEGAQSRTIIRALLADHGVHPDKQLGQNFLADPNIVRKIVSVADIEGRNVVEVGAGTGSLTAELAARAGRVVAYEVDPSLLPILAETVGDSVNVEVRNTDVTSIALFDELDGEPWTMVANLPYNVGTGIVLDALRHTGAVDRFVVMVQSEVADRMLSSPGNRTYGLPSVVVGLHAKGHRSFTVPPQVFEPPPSVESTVVVLDRVAAPRRAERAIEIAAVGFGQRRKMLRRSLSSLFEDPIGLMEAAGVDPTSRPEQLLPSDYVALADAERAVDEG